MNIYRTVDVRQTNQKEFACPTLPQNPQSETLQGNVAKSMADNNPLRLSVDLFLRYVVIFSAFNLSCAPVARCDALGRGSSHCISWYQIQPILMSATTPSCGTIVALDSPDP